MLDTLPIYVWDVMFHEELCNDPHVLQNLRSVSKSCNQFFQCFVEQAIKIRLKVPYITQPGTDLYVHLFDFEYCFAPMKWTDNHVWICDMLMIPSPLASLQYNYAVITNDEAKTQRREDRPRILNLREFAHMAGNKHPVVCDDRWGTFTSISDMHKFKDPAGTLPGCVIDIVNDKLICDCNIFAAYRPDAQVGFISETFAVSEKKIAMIQYAKSYSREHTLHIGELGSKDYYHSTPVSNGLCGTMNIIIWQDKIITDGEDCTFEVRSWDGTLEKKVKLIHKDPAIARVNWVHSFQVWNDHLVVVGHGMVYIYNSKYECIKGWTVADASHTVVVWNDLLAVSAGCKIMLFDWAGKCVQVLRGHTACVGELTFKDDLLVSCPGVEDHVRGIRVWDSKGICLAIYKSKSMHPRHAKIWKNALYACPSRSSSQPIAYFAWPWGKEVY